MTIRSSGNGPNMTVQGDVVCVRLGDIVTVVVQVGLFTAPSIQTFERVVRRAVDKVKRARH